jgi:protein involved in temperature-dependent protein secretion
MFGADELLANGDIDGARSALVEAVRKQPADQRARMFLLQLLVICGEWDKAVTQANALAGLSPEAMLLAALVKQLVEAERQREAAFAGEVPVTVLVNSSPWVEDAALAIGALARGEIAQASALREKAFEAAPDTLGECDGKGFGWIADADPRFGPCLEAMIGGRWGLIPFEAISTLESKGAVDLRDLVWLPVELSLRSGQAAAGFIPTRYPGSAGAAPMLRLARGTKWREGRAGDEGLGQRLLAFDDGDEIPLLSLRRLTMLQAE